MSTAAVAFPIQGPGFFRPVTPAIAVRTPAWRIAIANTDVTREITPAVLSVKYEDYATGKSDAVEVAIANLDGRWRNGWYPTKRDRLDLWIGYDGDPLLACGEFQIDELEDQGPPDVFTIKALSTGTIPDLRTKRSLAFEGQTLVDVVNKVAARHGFTVVGDVEPITVGRLTQRSEDDLTFLDRLARRYGYVFTVRAAQLVFHQVATLDTVPPTLTLTPTSVKTHHLTDKTVGTFRAASFTWHEPKTNTDISLTVDAKGVTEGDVLSLQDIPADTIDQAETEAKASLALANRGAAKGTLTLEGNPRLVAGRTIKLDQWGKFNGNYTTVKSEHALHRESGYETEIEIERVQPEASPSVFAFGGSGATSSKGGGGTF